MKNLVVCGIAILVNVTACDAAKEQITKLVQKVRPDTTHKVAVATAPGSNPAQLPGQSSPPNTAQRTASKTAPPPSPSAGATKTAAKTATKQPMQTAVAQSTSRPTTTPSTSKPASQMASKTTAPKTTAAAAQPKTTPTTAVATPATSAAPRKTVASTTPSGPPPLSANAMAALDDLDSRYATNFDLHPGWFRDRPLAYYDFGPTPQPTVVGRVIWPIYGFDAHGNPVAITGQHPIFSAIPGVAPYSGFWRLTYVITADHVHPNELRDADAVDALVRRKRAIVKPTDMVLNLPVVARGSRLAGDSTSPTYGWYAGREIQYFDFGAATVAPVPLFVFTRGKDASGQPVFFREQNNVADTIPARAPFPDLWAIELVQVDSAYVGNTWRNAASIVRGGRVESAHSLRNCPVVIVDGSRVTRDPSPLRRFADNRSPLPPSPTIIP